jgi:methionyl-tRNA formyltransferase
MGGPLKRVVFLGSGDVGHRSLELLLRAARGGHGGGFEVSLAVTHGPQKQGRGMKLVPSRVAGLAADAGVGVCTLSARSDEFLEQFAALRPDLAVTAAFGQMLPQSFLDVPTYGTLNIHPSLLPRWRGAAPVQRSLQAGDGVAGVSVARTVLALDAGPLLAQRRVALSGDEHAPELLLQLFERGTQDLVDALGEVWRAGAQHDDSGGAGGSASAYAALGTEQDEAGVTVARKVRKGDGAVCFGEHTAAAVHNNVRAFSGWPGTSVVLKRGKKTQHVKLIATRRQPRDDSCASPAAGGGGGSGIDIPGIGELRGDALRVACADGEVLEVLELQPVGKAVMSARDFCNGVRGGNASWATES